MKLEISVREQFMSSGDEYMWMVNESPITSKYIIGWSASMNQGKIDAEAAARAWADGTQEPNVAVAPESSNYLYSTEEA